MSQWKKKAVIEVRRARCIIRPVFFSADGKTLASKESGEILLSDAATGTELRRIKDVGHGPFAFAPDGKTLASAGKGDIRFWEAATGTEMFRLSGPPGWTFNLSFTRDGKRLASVGEDRTVRVWDVAARKEWASFVCREYEARSLAFSPDGSRLAVGTQGALLIWPVPAR